MFVTGLNSVRMNFTKEDTLRQSYSGAAGKSGGERIVWHQLF